MTERETGITLIVLSPQDRKFWTDHGFLVLPGFAADSDLGAVNRLLLKVWEERPSNVVVDDLITVSPNWIGVLGTASKLNDAISDVRRLVLNEQNPEKSFTVKHGPWPANNFPFTTDAAPITMEVKAKQIPEWTLDRYGLCAVLQDGPVSSERLIFPIDEITCCGFTRSPERHTEGR